MKELKRGFFETLAMKIARTMLHIGATTWKKSGDPYTWASGVQMRIYNDNRMMLGNYWHRLRVALGFAKLIKTHAGCIDFVLGTSTAGIAPAAGTAQLIGKPLVINHEGRFYQYNVDLIEDQILETLHNCKRDADVLKKPFVILSTTPFAIPYGVQYANQLKTGFAYIRATEKGHGKKQKVEGILTKGSHVVLIHRNVEEGLQIETELKEMGMAICDTILIKETCKLHGVMSITDLANKTAVVIEDLFSSGGSAAMEVSNLRNAGVVCNFCFSIFDYEFKVLKEQFSGETEITGKKIKLATPCTTISLLPFSTLIKEMDRIDFYTTEVRAAMEKEISGFDKKYREQMAAKDWSQST